MCYIQALLFYLAARKCLTCTPSHVLKPMTLHSEPSKFNPAKLILFTSRAAAVTSSKGVTADKKAGLEFPCQLPTGLSLADLVAVLLQAVPAEKSSDRHKAMPMFGALAKLLPHRGLQRAPKRHQKKLPQVSKGTVVL